MAYYGYQPYPMYQPPMADQLTQLRQNQFQPMQNQQFHPQQAPASPSIVWVQNEMEAATIWLRRIQPSLSGTATPRWSISSRQMPPESHP